MRIGIIGTGNIASYLLDSIDQAGKPEAQITAVFGRNVPVGEKLAQQYGVAFFTDFHEFITSPIDLVVEAATVEVAIQHMKSVLEHQKDIIVSSIGAFQDDQFLKEMKQTAKDHAVNIYLPSGAIGGLDLLQSANSLGGLHEVSITTRKSPASLGLEAMNQEEVLFEGSAREAVAKFPKNVNVALLLSLAGLGPDQTTVQVIADPRVERNTHTIQAAGDFGTMNLQIENLPMPNNPKTSYLAALSILSTLQTKENSFRIGS